MAHTGIEPSSTTFHWTMLLRIIFVIQMAFALPARTSLHHEFRKNRISLSLTIEYISDKLNVENDSSDRVMPAATCTIELRYKVLSWALSLVKAQLLLLSLQGVQLKMKILSGFQGNLFIRYSWVLYQNLIALIRYIQICLFEQINFLKKSQ